MSGPAAERHIHPLVKLLLEVGPIAVFFLAYRLAPVDEGLSTGERQLEQILFSTKVFVPTILLALAASYALTRHLPKMAVITAVVVTVFGGLTLVLRDDTFVKMKPTILYAIFAGILVLPLIGAIDSLPADPVAEADSDAATGSTAAGDDSPRPGSPAALALCPLRSGSITRTRTTVAG